MATLHDTTELTKKVGLYAALGIIVIVILVFTFRTGLAIKNFFLPPGPPPPTVAFGKVTKVPFPQNVTQEQLTYEIDTISGVLPTFPTQLKVYKVVQKEPSFFNLQRARDKVSRVGFRGREQKKSDNEYQWVDEGELLRSMVMNIITQNFTLTSFYPTYPPVVNGENIPDESGAQEKAKNFLASMDLLPSDIDISKTRTELFSLKDGILIPASSLSTAQIIRVDFYQKDRDEIPMYYPRPPYSAMSFLISSDTGVEYNSVVDGKFYHQEFNEKGETYPIKTAELAFEELKQGKGYIASFLGADRNVKITEVTLGYYLSDQKQEYILPIIVFKGENDFYAFVQAVNENWIK